VNGTASPLDPDLERVARDWIAADPDPATREELERLLADSDATVLHERFDHPLTFGTAGLRGVEGAGPGAMNCLVVRRTAQGVADWITSKGDAAMRAGVVVGRDARRGSAAFARETTDVLSRGGIAVHEFARPLPTPLAAFSVRHLRAAGGVVVTASHNPARDNGYKVYDEDGSQIVPPVDEQIEAAARRRAVEPPPQASVPGVVATIDDEALLAAYEARLATLVDPMGPRDLLVAYTPLHGVGGAVVPGLLRRAGFTVEEVAEQAEPDPAFPTVPFPNPEEPGALDLAIALARRIGADLVVANDPDADRLCVAVPDRGSFRPLSGDELGAILGDVRCAATSGEDRLAATTIVSSSMLAEIAASHGVAFAETLTGFKWLGRAGAERGRRLVFAYEEALGYAVSDAVADKDGMSAALLACAVAAQRKADGSSLLEAFDELSSRFGVHATVQRSYRREGAGGQDAIAATVEGLLTSPPTSLGGAAVSAVEDLAMAVDGLPATEGVRLRCASVIRVVVRPSGTEPKLKAYVEVVQPPVPRGDVVTSRERARAILDAVVADVDAICG
jgi:phosphomannomutase